MEKIIKTSEQVSFISEINVSLANAIRKSVGEIPILAITEVDIYKNDSALYDEIIAHRLGLLPLKNQKMKVGQFIEMKLKGKGKSEDGTMILAEDIDGDVIYPETPLVLLGDGQEIEMVARAKTGKGINHAKFMPGMAFYKHLPKIQISKEGEKYIELAKIYPEVFEIFGENIKVKNAAACDLDQDDMEEYPGINIKFDNKLVFTIESWGQIKAEEIFIGSCKALKDNLSKVSKIIK